MEWLKKQIKKIEADNCKYKEEIDTIKNIEKDVSNEFNEKTTSIFRKTCEVPIVCE